MNVRGVRQHSDLSESHGLRECIIRGITVEALVVRTGVGRLRKSRAAQQRGTLLQRQPATPRQSADFRSQEATEPMFRCRNRPKLWLAEKSGVRRPPPRILSMALDVHCGRSGTKPNIGVISCQVARHQETTEDGPRRLVGLGVPTVCQP